MLSNDIIAYNISAFMDDARALLLLNKEIHTLLKGFEEGDYWKKRYLSLYKEDQKTFEKYIRNFKRAYIRFNKILKGDAFIYESFPLEIWGKENRIQASLKCNKIGKIPHIFKGIFIDSLILENNILREFPKALLEANGIEELNLSKNYIKSVPSLRSFNDLQCLSLSYCGLSGELDISYLTNLRKLNLDNNKLTKVLIDCKGSLLILRLDRNLLKELPNLKEYNRLMSLDVSSNNLGKIPDFITQLRNLIRLGIDDTGISKFPKKPSKSITVYARKNGFKWVPKGYANIRVFI